uniref:Uncharacterized protein n=1 Tax=Glypta fumiferanae TaxID=389681 RepID=A0A0F6Q8X8_9HYME|nr:hypothetical protein [Glypta fumiferanae]
MRGSDPVGLDDRWKIDRFRFKPDSKYFGALHDAINRFGSNASHDKEKFETHGNETLKRWKISTRSSTDLPVKPDVTSAHSHLYRLKLYRPKYSTEKTKTLPKKNSSRTTLPNENTVE